MPHLSTLLRLGLLTVLLALCAFAGCGGNAGLPAGSPGALTANVPEESGTTIPTPEPVLPDVPFPFEYSVVPSGNWAAGRTASDETDFTRAGDEYFSIAANAVPDLGQHLLILNPGIAGFSWGMYQFVDVAPSESPFSLRFGFSDVPDGDYWVGLADYSTLHWYWLSIIPSGGDDSLAMPAGVDPLSPGGNLYVAVVAADPVTCTLQSVTLTKNVALPPPQGFTASDGTSASAVLLDWTDPAESYPALDYDSITIERAPAAGGPWAEIGSAPAGETHYDDVYNAAGNDYPYNTPVFYRLITVADAVQSVPSLIDSGFRVLGNVTGLTASDGTFNDGIHLSWSAVGGADGYLIEYALAEIDPPGWTQLIELPAQATFVHSPTDPPGAEAAEGVAYLYRAKAHYQGEDSAAWSNVDQGSFLATPVAVLEASISRAAAPIELQLNAAGSFDPGGGEIIKYEWDWDGNGVWDFDSGVESQVDHSYSTFGTFTAKVRVTDDELQTAIDDTVIEVPGWIHTWGGAANDQAAAVAIDSLGNVWVCGSTNSPGTGSADIILLKYSATGELLSRWTWDNGGADVPTAMICVNDVLYITGQTEIPGDGHPDVLMMQYATSGSLVSQQAWDSEDGSVANSMAFDESGNVYYAGRVDPGDGGTAVLALKLDSAGAILMSKYWDLPANDEARSCAAEGDNFFITGDCEGGTTNQQLLLLRITGEAADLSWEKSWDGGTLDAGYTLKLEGGGVIIGGSTNIADEASTDGLLLRCDPDGNVEWQRTWGQLDHAEAFYGMVAGSGMFFLTGTAVNDGDSTVPIVAVQGDGSMVLFERLFGSGAIGNRVAFTPVVDDQVRLFLAGEAKNIQGSWINVYYGFVDCAGVQANISGEYQDIVGTIEDLDGTEGTFLGGEDFGAGNAESLVMCYETLLLE